MKIIQINIYYNEGSTGKIVADIHTRLLRDGHKSYVVFGMGKHEVKDDPEHLYRTTTDRSSLFYRRISRILTGLRFNVAYLETYKLLRYIKIINPDIVHLHCLNEGYLNPYLLLKYLGKQNYPVLVTNHADITLSANCAHAFECNKWKTGCGKCLTVKREKRAYFIDNTRLSWIQMKKAFSYVKSLYASGVSRWMSIRVVQSPFFRNIECRTITNGLDTDSFKYRHSTDLLRQKLGLKKDDKIILHVTPQFSAEIKGGKYVVKIAKIMPQIKFVVVGITEKESAGLPDNIIAINHTDSREQLSMYYSMADLTLLTSYKESFSMVTAESLCCGTPVVGFKAGAPETIAIPEYSQFVEYGDTEELANAIKTALMSNYDKSAISALAKDKYNAESMYQGYLQYYSDIIKSCRS